MKTILSSRKRHYVAVISIFLIVLIMATLTVGMAGCGGGPIRIYTWFGLDKVRDNLGGSYILMNDLDSTSTTTGYSPLASATANGGKGWDPIGSSDEFFTGTFDGQGYEIRDVVINRPARDRVGLFGAVDGGVVKNLGVVNATVTGQYDVGGLIGFNNYSYDTVSNCYFAGNVTGIYRVGGLVGYNIVSGVSNSYYTGNVTGDTEVGGLVGSNAAGLISDSYSTGSVTGTWKVGGLVGRNYDVTVTTSYSTSSVTGTKDVGGLVGLHDSEYLCVSNSYFMGNVTGDKCVGGLAGCSYAGVGNSYYDYDKVLINGENIITIGALFGEDFDQWLDNDKFLDVSERLYEEDDYYLISDVSDFKQLLAFGQNASLKFKLTNDLDLATEPNFYIPYLAGEFDGNGHNISNLSFNFDFVSNVGLFGFLDYGAKVTQVGVENVNVTGYSCVGGLVGAGGGTVSNSYSIGNVTGEWQYVGGLVGFSDYFGTVSNCYATGSVTGGSEVGGLMGYNDGTVSTSYSAGNVTGDSRVGGLMGYNDGTVSTSYSTGSVTGATVVGGLVGAGGGTVSNSYSIGNVTGNEYIGGLVGFSYGGSVTNSFWNTQTSGQATSAGGTGKNTTEMQDFDTFTDTETEGLDESWDIIAVDDPGDRNTGYIWNIVDDVTYPFLSWQP